MKLITMLTLALGGFLGLAALGLSIEEEDWVVPAGDPNRSISIRDSVRALKPGGALTLTKLRTQVGREVELALIEGTFETSAITPKPNWTGKYWKNAVLVNSVDEQQTAAAGVSGVILAGCGVTSNRAPLQRGEVQLHECPAGAAYRDLGIQRIANVAIVTWAKVADSEPCISSSDNGGKDRSDCVEASVQAGLLNVVNSLRKLPSAEQPDALILPALGTGIGGLQKSRFYKAAVAVVLGELNNTGGYLPPKIFFHEWAGSSAGFFNAAHALGTELAGLESGWTKQHPRGSATAYFVAAGACAALAVVLGIAILRRRANESNTPLPPAFGAQFAIGWLLAAVGAGTGLQRFLSDLGPKYPILTSPLLVFALGFSALFACGYLLRASDLFKQSIANPVGQPKPSESDQQPN